MNILFLKYAVEVANVGSINKAAEKLCVSQPSLSRAIKELEKELSITIFERTSFGISPTPDGEKLISYGRKILREIDDVENMFTSSAKEKKHFSISVPRASYIGEAIASFSLKLRNENDFEIFYKETNASRAIKNILEQNYGLGIIRYAEKYENAYKSLLEEKGLVGETIAEFSYGIVMSKRSPMAELSDIRFSDLENFIELAHADPYVPSLPLSVVRKEELPDNVRRRIFVFERASQLEILSKNDETFMWTSPLPDETLERYGLVRRQCVENAKKYKDVLIRKKEHKLSKYDTLFITELCNVKREIF